MRRQKKKLKQVRKRLVVLHQIFKRMDEDAINGTSAINDFLNDPPGRSGAKELAEKTDFDRFATGKNAYNRCWVCEKR